MKFGCTVNIGVFSEYRVGDALELYNAFGSVEEVFAFLGANVDSVELHTVRDDTDLEQLEKAVLTCREYGLSCTYHGSLKTYTTPENFFAPYEYLLKKGLADNFTITLHPQDQYEYIVEVLKALCDYAGMKQIPVMLCLENQRIQKDRMAEGICQNVADIVSCVNSAYLNVCFDFGHRKSNAEKYGDDADVVPEDFYRRTAHTHIHSWYEGTTHYPIHVGKVQLETNLLALFRNGYDGVLNLELCPGRFCGTFDVKEGFCNSVSVLKTATEQARAMLAAMEKYEQYEDNAKPVFEALQREKFSVGAIAPAAYVFRFGDVKLAIDPSFAGFSEQEEKYAYLITKLQDFDAVFITHGHSDHYSPYFLEELGKSIKVYVPDFLECANTVPYTVGDSVKLGELTVTGFVSCHDEPGMNPYPEYGLNLTYRGKTITMPADIRDYRTDRFRGMKADLLIGHLWLGRGNGLNLYNNTFIAEFCDFINGFDASRVFIGHMDDVRRNMQSIWTDVHFAEVQKNIPNVETIKFGDCKSLAWLGFEED